MPVRTIHKNACDWYITFTCFEWLPLFEITDSYELVYKWFVYLHDKNKADVLSYVVMPNHFHAILHLQNEETDLNKLVANGKRFLAYGIIERLLKNERHEIILRLANGVNNTDKKKGQKHRVFETSFDAKSLDTDKFVLPRP